MSEPSEPHPSMKYDDVLTQILVNENSILGFLSTVFNFLARRTDFYYVAEGPHEQMGFPPGVAEELVIKVLRSCDPQNWKPPNGARKPADINNEIMCSTVAQEVEIIANEEVTEQDNNVQNITNMDIEDNKPKPTTPVIAKTTSKSKVIEPQFKKSQSEGLSPSTSTDKPLVPPLIPTQKNSETYNGAERDTYSWAQTIMDLDITVKLPPEVKSSKDLKVTINPGDICVACCSGNILFKDFLPYKIKAIDSFWTISEGKLLIHLEKVQERWWNKFLSNESPIDLSKIDCSRSLDELPDDHVAKIRELQWNQEQKIKGLPTSDQLRNIEILKKAWNEEGSPFKGKEFDPSVLQHN